jgi:GTPase SAR1 family protein
MSKTQSQASVLADRLCRPQRIGVFGHRGVGKTTFLTMLYREAVGGRIPNLRLAAADARTADYLADKILQLEAGQPLPATLAETDLHFHLYHQNTRLDLLLKDYQGEHVAVGREEPIREFLRKCDAVWLCLDVGVAAASDSCLHSQQEVEQLVEDYLAAQPPGTPLRPMALVLTKADLLPSTVDNSITMLVQEHLGMTRHALLLHSPQHAVMAVSSLGQPIPTHALAIAGDNSADDPGEVEAPPAFQPRPTGLAEPLLFLTTSLQEQDEARLAQIWQLEPNNLGLLQRCSDCFTRRYPDAQATRKYAFRLRQLRSKIQRRRLLVAGSALMTLVLALWGYDAWGRYQVQCFERAQRDDSAALLQEWQQFLKWHPTRHLFPGGGGPHAESDHLRDLELADLRRQAEDPDVSPETIWDRFQKFREDHPDQNIDDPIQEFRNTLKARRDAERERKAVLAFEGMLRKEAQIDLPAQIAEADKLLAEYGDTGTAGKVKERLSGYQRRVEEQVFESARTFATENPTRFPAQQENYRKYMHRYPQGVFVEQARKALEASSAEWDKYDFETARAYSKQKPFNFSTRQENFSKYLQQHPQGAYAAEARKALEAVAGEWDKYDFRKVRDHFQEKPGEVKELDTLCRAYLAAQPTGRYRDSARELLRWSERVRGDNEYKVTIKSGSFDPKSVGYFSRGLSLSVELEVNGVPYGPSTIVKRSAEPEWNYEFPRPIRWRLGDRVRVKVIDHYYWQRTIVDVSSDNDDQVAMKMLSGSVSSGKHTLIFESDLGIPVLPKLE